MDLICSCKTTILHIVTHYNILPVIMSIVVVSVVVVVVVSGVTVVEVVFKLLASE